jgi:hypothetical protein
MRRVVIQALACVLCAGFAAPAAQTKKRAPVRDRSTAAPYWVPYPQFSDAEVRLVVNWFQDALEAGKRHFTAIPAAIASQIHVGGKLTASAVKSLTAPPPELLAKLPPLPDGYERQMAGSVLLIVKTDEQLVVDVMSVVAPR